MSIKHLDPMFAEELRQLYAALPDAAVRVLAALKTDPGRVLEGPALAHFEIEDAKLAAIIRRIKEIHSTTGKLWNA